MNNVLITSKDFGSQLGVEHRNQLAGYLEENGWHILWNPQDQAMSAQEIIRVNEKYPLAAIIVYSSSDQISREVFEQCRSLKVVSRHGVGIENIDKPAAQVAGVQVKTTADMPGYETVADLTFALMLSLARKVHIIDAHLRNNKWYRPIASDVWGKTLGIVGLGRIGKAVVQRAKGFGMKLLVHTGHPDPEYLAKNAITLCTKEELLASADYITLHSALTEETRGMIGAQEFSQMKTSAYLINTARSGLVDQKALLAALTERRIAGAAIDVFDIEPVANDPLLQANFDSLVATSHVGSYTYDSLRRMDFAAAENIVECVKVAYSA